MTKAAARGLAIGGSEGAGYRRQRGGWLSAAVAGIETTDTAD